MQTITEGVPLPVFPNHVPQNAAMRFHKSKYAFHKSKYTFGASSANVVVLGNSVVRNGGEDLAAAAVGARGVREGVHVFTFKIDRTRGNDGLGIFVGVAAAIDFQNRSAWGAAYAMGLHGRNLFSWRDGLAAATLERGALEGSEDSVEDGSVVRVRVDMETRELSFSINSGEYEAAKGLTLPLIVRPFCKLAGFTGDMVAMAYEGDEASLAAELAPPTAFEFCVPQNASMLRHGVHYQPAVLGPHGSNVRLDDSTATVIRAGGRDHTAAAVGARGTQFGVATYTFRLDHTLADDGLGVFVGVADGGVDYANEKSWGDAWALGCHGGNIFQWEDGLAKGALVRGALPGIDEGFKNGTVVCVRVDMGSRELSFSVDGTRFVVAKGITLPRTVRPFCKLSGSSGDRLSLAYDGEALPPCQRERQLTLADEALIEATIDAALANPKLPRTSSDTVLSAFLE